MTSIPASDCERAAALLPEHWFGSLAAQPEQVRWLQDHLSFCSTCAALHAVWTDLGELPSAVPAADPTPTARLRLEREFVASRAAAERRRWFGGAISWPAAVPAWAAALLLAVGLAGGWLLGWRLHAPTAAPDQSTQIASLRQEIESTRQLAVLSLLRQQSANDRLQGATYGARLKDPDPQVTTALLRSLEYDPSPDVRLAALDALTRQANHAPVAQDLVRAFSHQDSPLVQIALVDSFIQLRDGSARTLLQHISTDPSYLPAVRQRAAWGLAQPSWN